MPTMAPRARIMMLLQPASLVKTETRLAGAMPASALSGRLKDIYDSYFEITLAETDEQRQAAFRLRYEVYCVEHPYEDPQRNPSGMETDQFDAAALHAVLTHRQ